MIEHAEVRLPGGWQGRVLLSTARPIHGSLASEMTLTAEAWCAAWPTIAEGRDTVSDRRADAFAVRKADVGIIDVEARYRLHAKIVDVPALELVVIIVYGIKNKAQPEGVPRILPQEGQLFEACHPDPRTGKN